MLSVPSARPDYVGWGGEWGRWITLCCASSPDLSLMKPKFFRAAISGSYSASKSRDLEGVMKQPRRHQLPLPHFCG